MNRRVIAFLVAPLAVPLFVAIEAHPWEWHRLLNPLLLYLSIVIGYAGTLLFGIPAYLFLRARKWTTFWIAPIAGFIAGWLAWWLLGILVIWSGGRLLELHGYLDWLRRSLPYATLGAVVGTLLWLIARPDRTESREASQGRRRTAFWMAPILGFVGVSMAWWLFTTLLGLYVGGDLFDLLQMDVDILWVVLWPVGPLGALVGSVLWFVARPDRSAN